MTKNELDYIIHIGPHFMRYKRGIITINFENEKEHTIKHIKANVEKWQKKNSTI